MNEIIEQVGKDVSEIMDDLSQLKEPFESRLSPIKPTSPGPSVAQSPASLRKHVKSPPVQLPVSRYEIRAAKRMELMDSSRTKVEDREELERTNASMKELKIDQVLNAAIKEFNIAKPSNALLNLACLS